MKEMMQGTCKISSIEKGALKNLYVVKMYCNNDLKIEFDITKELSIFSKDEEVTFIISREKPEYSEKDFCAHGYLFLERQQDDGSFIDEISLYGLIVKILSKNGLINSKLFKMMDHIYYCVKKKA
ncbi:DNA-directed RNA polymerase subunit G [Sulfolobus acidocaldarius SUSAZ]|nr:DNA-directed RNA polymerase subunit G [Sulfolobus acidocaldarius SUSAZ]